jgi:hypothetical protein
LVGRAGFTPTIDELDVGAEVLDDLAPRRHVVPRLPTVRRVFIRLISSAKRVPGSRDGPDMALGMAESRVTGSGVIVKAAPSPCMTLSSEVDVAVVRLMISAPFSRGLIR